jgi:hypothetical protein
MVTVHRDFDGVRIEGSHYAVVLHPAGAWREAGDATLHISVLAAPALTGWESWTCLAGEDTPRHFTAADVGFGSSPAGTEELRCLYAGIERAPAFREGLVFALEPGMRAPIETALPAVERVARAAGAMRDAVEPHLGRRPHPHEDNAISELVALRVLDQLTPADALARTRGYKDAPLFDGRGDHPSYTELGAALRRDDVITVLTGAVHGT